MSIIYDALKKSEDSADKGKIIPSGSSKKKSKLSGSLLVICIIAIGLFALSKLPKKKSEVVAPLDAQKMQEAQVVAPESLPPENKPSVPVSQGYPAAEYLLEGIIYSQDNPLAIINGKILKKGAKIDDLEIVDINPESVQLRNTEDSTSLSLSLK